MPTFEVKGAVYHYIDKGNGKPLILLHGFMGSAQSWGEITSALGQQHRVIVVDILGHGSSSCPANPQRYRIESAATDLAALLNSLKATSANLIGYSMGARLALYFALTYPHLVYKLVLESGSPGIESQDERDHRVESDNYLAKHLLRDGIAAFVEYWERLPLFESQSRLPDAVLAKQREQRLKNNPTGLANSLRGMGTGSQPSLWSRLGEVKSPTLLMTGELDSKYSAIAQRMAQLISLATLEIVPGGGHNVHLEQPETYIQLIEGFLEG